MKRLILIRHAKSSWSDSSLDDFDRPLNDRGHRDAPAMAHRLAERLDALDAGIDCIISSSSVRTRQTMDAFLDVLEVRDDRLHFDDAMYHADVSAMLDMVRAADDSHSTLALCGHNPGLTELACAMTGEYIDNIPTCGIADIVFDVDRWADVSPDSGELIDFDYPKRMT